MKKQNYHLFQTNDNIILERIMLTSLILLRRFWTFYTFFFFTLHFDRIKYEAVSITCSYDTLQNRLYTAETLTNKNKWPLFYIVGPCLQDMRSSYANFSLDV